MPEKDRPISNGAEEGDATAELAPAPVGTRSEESGKPRARRPRAEQGRGDPPAPVKAEELNSIRPARVRHRAARPVAAREFEPAPSEPKANDESTAPWQERIAGKAESDPWTVPQQVRDRFVQDGDRFYFRDGTLAFRDHGRRLSTQSENTVVIASLIDIARSRRWQQIAVEGTEEFRREAWRQGRLAGLGVRGYKAPPGEHSAMIRALSQKDERSQPEDPFAPTALPPEARPPEPSDQSAQGPESRKRADEFLVGKLVDHGRDSYRFDPHQEMSYFVRIKTGEGERTIWGKDLQRAIEQSLTQPKTGDEIAMRRIGSDPVTVKRRERDAEGQVLKEEDLATQRYRWVLEKREFFEARARAAETFSNPVIQPHEGARKHPELVASYLKLHAAELTAVKRLRDPEDRKKFVALIRSSLADSIARGEPLQPVRLRERSQSAPELEREPALERD
jgi:Large polyvalent protein-associated domain 7